MQDHTRYLFIDGGYARTAYQHAMHTVFDDFGEIDVAIIAQQARAFRTYYYDCLDETQGNTESDVQFQQRVETQRTYFERIRSMVGVHLQLGTLTGTRPKRQKEVDVLLAVDMLTHGFNRNMTHAALLTGDLDFRPVVEALVRSGVYVEVWFEKTTAAKELYWAADLGQQLDFGALYNWSDQRFRSTHGLPTFDTAHPPVTGELLHSGTCGGRPVQILREPNSHIFVLRAENPDGVVWSEHTDQTVLERYFSLVYGPVEWQA